MGYAPEQQIVQETVRVAETVRPVVKDYMPAIVAAITAMGTIVATWITVRVKRRNR